MSKRVRCISRKVNGMLHVAVPQLYLDPFEDGEERDLPDEVADRALRSPCFEEVVPKTEPKPDPKTAIKADAQLDGGKS